MKPTSDDFKPRRDGLFEHRATWREVRVGTVLGDPEKRSKAWEVVDIAQVGPARYGYTNWFRIKDLSTGELHPVEPKPASQSVIILTDDPMDQDTGPIVAPSDAERIMMLVKQLGAETLASHDSITGEVVCPDYVVHSHIENGSARVTRGLREHLRFAHNINGEGMGIAELTTVHGESHSPRYPKVGKTGFAHRHVPEEPWLCP